MQILKVFAFYRAVRGVIVTLIVIVAMIVMTAFHCPQQGMESSQENQLKAVFLFNFTQFVQWPTTAFANEAEPFVIGVLGKNIFKNYLEKTVEGEQVNNRQIVIRYFDRVSPELRECEILFIEKSFPEIKHSLETVKGRATLTVSDDENFMKQEGMLRFLVENSKIRLEINQKAAAASDLEISSKLLRVATLHATE